MPPVAGLGCGASPQPSAYRWLWVQARLSGSSANGWRNARYARWSLALAHSTSTSRVATAASAEESSAIYALTTRPRCGRAPAMRVCPAQIARRPCTCALAAMINARLPPTACVAAVFATNACAPLTSMHIIQSASRGSTLALRSAPRPPRSPRRRQWQLRRAQRWPKAWRERRACGWRRSSPHKRRLQMSSLWR